MVKYARALSGFLICWICVGFAQEISQRNAKFLSLDKLKSRYIAAPLASLPFLRDFWTSKPPGGMSKNSTKEPLTTKGPTTNGPSSLPPAVLNPFEENLVVPIPTQATVSDLALPVLDVIPADTVAFPVHSGVGPVYDYSCPPCWCGVANRMDRIVGGWTTEVNEYPWMVALLHQDRFFCGGTLISDRYVLTAAHCFRNSKRHRNLTAVFSEHNRALVHETEIETRRVVKVLSYPKYNAKAAQNHDHDIALLRLDRPLEIKPSVSPVCMPRIGEKFTQRSGTVVGWGRTDETGQVSPELRATQVPIMSNQECRQFPGFEPKLSGNMMCAGYAEGGKDSCQGDSGGSLLTEDLDSRFVIAGIVSWGIGCARPNSPGVYTRVNHYMDWIQENTRDACFCF